MRKITLINVHCTANRAGSALRMADIDRYHRSLGWKGCGYHYVIPIDGTIEAGRPEEVVGAHCKNHNRHSSGWHTWEDLQLTAGLPATQELMHRSVR